MIHEYVGGTYTGTPKCDSSTFMCTSVNCSANSDCYPYHHSLCGVGGKCTAQCGNHIDCKQLGFEKCGADQTNIVNVSISVSTRGNLGKQYMFAQCYDTSFCNTSSSSKNETTLNIQPPLIANMEL